MKVFSAYLKILARNKISIAISLVIYIFVALFTSSSGAGDVASSFSESKVDIAVIDRDNSDTSKALKAFLQKSQNLVELEDNLEVLQEALYYREVYYILTIPENFEADLTAGKAPTLTNIKAPNSTAGIYIDTRINELCSMLKGYIASGCTPYEAIQKAATLVNKNIEVAIFTDETTLETAPGYSSYFILMPYALIASLISGISIAILAFNQKDLHMRTVCSALPLRNQNAQLILGSIVFSIIVYVILVAVPLIAYKGAPITSGVFGYQLLNIFCMLLVCIALSYLIGTLCKSEDHISMYSTTVSLFMCFLGGIFVPLSVISDKIVMFSRFLPTYWYARVANTLSMTTKLQGTALTETFYAYGIQVLFAVALLAIALVVTKKKMQAA